MRRRTSRSIGKRFSSGSSTRKIPRAIHSSIAPCRSVCAPLGSAPTSLSVRSLRSASHRVLRLAGGEGGRWYARRFGARQNGSEKTGGSVLRQLQDVLHFENRLRIALDNRVDHRLSHFLQRTKPSGV